MSERNVVSFHVLLLLLTVVLGCDPEATTPEDDAASAGGKADDDEEFESPFPEPLDFGSVGFHWYTEKGESYPNFEASRPRVLIFVHGWQQPSASAELDLDFHFEALTDDVEPLDRAAALQAEGWNVGILDWFDLANTQHVSEAERAIWNEPRLDETLESLYVTALTPIDKRRLELGREAPEIWLVGESAGAQLVSRLLGALARSNRIGPDLMPDRVVFLAAYFSQKNKCSFPSFFMVPQCIRDWNNSLDFWPGERSRDELERFLDDDDLPDEGVVVSSYSVTDSLTDLVGDRNLEFFRKTAHLRLTASDQDREFEATSPLGSEFDYRLRRHAYPRYWFLTTLVYDWAPPTAFSPASPAIDLQSKMGSRFYYEQVDDESADNRDFRDDTFAQEGWRCLFGC